MLATRGWIKEEIGKHINISPNTVMHHLSNAMKHLGIIRRLDHVPMSPCLRDFPEAWPIFLSKTGHSAPPQIVIK